MSKWYTISCENCGTEIPVHEEWDNPPRFCKSCKADRAAKWYEVSCKNCGNSIHAHHDWDYPPVFCKECKEAHPPINASCSHCGINFSISTGAQINCLKNGWDLPKRCNDCRELFKHKPFQTVKEQDLLGNIVFRTYNSRGQIISETRDEVGFFGDNRRAHYSKTGKQIGITRDKTDIIGNPYRETTGLDGKIKSTSKERTDLLGNKFTESTGGTSETKHITRSQTSWTGKKYRETK